MNPGLEGGPAQLTAPLAVNGEAKHDDGRVLRVKKEKLMDAKLHRDFTQTMIRPLEPEDRRGKGSPGQAGQAGATGCEWKQRVFPPPCGGPSRPPLVS